MKILLILLIILLVFIFRFKKSNQTENFSEDPSRIEKYFDNFLNLLPKFNDLIPLIDKMILEDNLNDQQTITNSSDDEETFNYILNIIPQFKQIIPLIDKMIVQDSKINVKSELDENKSDILDEIQSEKKKSIKLKINNIISKALEDSDVIVKTGDNNEIIMESNKLEDINKMVDVINEKLSSKNNIKKLNLKFNEENNLERFISYIKQNYDFSNLIIKKSVSKDNMFVVNFENDVGVVIKALDDLSDKGLIDKFIVKI